MKLSNARFDTDPSQRRFAPVKRNVECQFWLRTERLLPPSPNVGNGSTPVASVARSVQLIADQLSAGRFGGTPVGVILVRSMD